MIAIHLPSRRKTSTITQITTAVSTMFNEASRREAIIKGLVKDLPYKLGDIVIPSDDSEYEKIGDLRVTAIADTYAKFGKKEKWPDNDVPMIIHVWCDKQKQVYFCSTNYLKKKPQC